MPRKSNKEVTDELLTDVAENTTTEKEETVTEEKTAKKAGKKTKTLFLERKRGIGEDNTVFVGVNGRNYLIKRGVPVEVPVAVYNVVMDSLKAEEELYNFIDNKAND